MTAVYAAHASVVFVAAELLGMFYDRSEILFAGSCAGDVYKRQALADAFHCSINDLPLTLVLSWYEQKAVCILLTLLSLGVHNMYIGPTLPAFMSETVVKYLVENYKLNPITAPEQDMDAILKG